MKIVMLQPPSPPGMNVKRDYAGGMGVADTSQRTTFGHDPGYITLPYMSLLYATGVMDREGHEVLFLDAQADDLDVAGVVERVRAFGPAVTVGVVNLPSLYGDLEVLKAIREGVADSRVMAIGTVVLPLYEFVAESGAVDAIVRGDPEVVLPALLEALLGAREDNRVEPQHGVLTNRTVMHVEDLDALPVIPYHLVPIERYWYHGFGRHVRYAAVFASRGCSFNCYYCPYPVGFGGRIVHRDVRRVVDEIEDLYNRHGVRAILFRDQVFSMEWEKTTALCDEIVRRGLKIEWVVETRLDRVNEAILRKMKEAGCVRIHYGLESGDPELFGQVGKDGVESGMEQLIENFLLTERLGIHAHMFVLIGLLGETWDTVRNTIKTVRRIKPLTLQVSVVTPYPGTKLYEAAREKGLLTTGDFSQYTGFKPVSRTEAMSGDDLREARALIIREHARAIRGKQLRHLARVAWTHLLDGSLPRRIVARLKR
jgi:radical SAM superfamily enzyme YgiQ (UPF0313 family)